MTREDFNALSDRERGALVAERVMGWQWDWDGMDGMCWWDADGKQTPFREGGSSMSGAMSRGFQPTTTWNGAGMVIERMEAEGWSWSMEQLYRESTDRREWRVRIGRPGTGDEDIWVSHEAWAIDLKEAISVAALAALGVLA